MIALDNEPFNLVNRIGFICLMKLPEPRYKLPSDKYLWEHLIPEIYQQVVEKMKCLLAKNAQTVGITTDIWNSIAQDIGSYISFTCHYITPEFECQQVYLQAAPFNSQHTGGHIAAMLKSSLYNWNLADNLHIVLRDNGSNFVAGLRDAEVPNYLVWLTPCSWW